MIQQNDTNPIATKPSFHMGHGRADTPARDQGIEPLAAHSRAMMGVLEQARRAAGNDAPVLISGEAGVGKRMLAKAIHEHSRRSGGPWVQFLVASIPKEEQQQALFGQVRSGSSNGTIETAGRVEAASGGTLMIDEVADLSAEAQTRLLSLIEHGRFCPLGGASQRTVDVRVLACTRHSLEERVHRGEFREDLFYRLNETHLRMPTLRDRREDIPELVLYFQKRAAEQTGRAKPRVTPSLMDHLQGLAWPGNVRQLRNCVETMTVMAAGDTLTREDLSTMTEDHDHGNSSLNIPPGMTLEQLERVAIEQSLETHHGNRTHAAAALGISVRTLQRKLKAWRLARSAQDE